jgi:glycosyltransferase involved in cell wall biosynthesis
MSHRVRLSVVVPSLNQSEFIDTTLQSLFSQRNVTSEELEVIVVDGGSRDGTIDILKRWSNKIAHWNSEPDKGQTDALRKGFEKATGDIQGWLCADDLLTPRAVREVLDFFTSHPGVDFVYGDAIWIDKQGRPFKLKQEIPFNWFIWLHDHNYIPQPAAFWRRELYNIVGGLNPMFDLAMDADLFARFAIRTQPHHVAKVWALLRHYPEQKNQRLRSQSDAEDQRIRRRLGVPSRGAAVDKAGFLAAKSARIIWKLFIGAYRPKMAARRICARVMN